MMQGMSLAAKVARSPIELRGGAERLALRALLKRAALVLVFVVVVLCGSSWAVYTTKYYDELDAAQPQGSTPGIGAGPTLEGR